MRTNPCVKNKNISLASDVSRAVDEILKKLYNVSYYYVFSADLDFPLLLRFLWVLLV